MAALALRVEDGLDEQQVGATIDQAAGCLGVGIGQLVEGNVARAGVVDVGRDGRGAVGGAERAGDEARPRWVAPFHLVARGRGQPRRGEIHLVGQRLHAIVGLRDAVGVKSVRLDQIGASFQIGQVDGADDVGLGQHEQVVVALHVAGPIGKARAAEVGLAQPVLLDHRAHSPIEDEDTARQLLMKLNGSVHSCQQKSLSR